MQAPGGAEVTMEFMTEADIAEGQQVATDLIAQVTNLRPAVAIAALALTFAAVTHLAKCGPEASTGLFRSFYDKLARMGA